MIRGFDLAGHLVSAGAVEARYGQECVIPCPKCDSRPKVGHWHLWVNTKTQVGFCFRCRRSYDQVDIVAIASNCTRREARHILKDGVNPNKRLQSIYGMLVPEVDSGKMKMEPIKLPAEYAPIVSGVPGYLAGRGVRLPEAVQYEMGTCSTGYYENRVIIPVRDTFGELVSFVARYMGNPPEGRKKVLYPKGSMISTVLFDEKCAAVAGTIVITEGVFDALAVSRAFPTGQCRAVALFGKHVSELQESRLVRLGSDHQLVVMLDADALDDACDVAMELAEVCPHVLYVDSYPSGVKDPGDAYWRQIEKMVARARRATTRRSLSSVADTLS